MSDLGCPVPVYEFSSSAQLLAEITVRREPAVIRSCPLGACLSWTPDQLRRSLSGLTRPVHVTNNSNMDFVSKNFKYSSMDLGDMIEKAQDTSTGEKYYLRAVNEEDPRSTPVRLEDDFPSISSDLQLPSSMLPSEQIFSSVLRVSSAGVRVWTHYDVMDNIYCQIIGSKRAVLWPPTQLDKLYMSGDKSRVVDIDNPDLDQFPLFPLAKKYVAELQPGDILFIPALWFHNMLAHDFGVAVNIFWRELDDKFYDTKDAYGNKDHVPAAKASQSADNIIKNLNQLPPEYRDFYCRRIVERLQSKCLLEQK